MPNAIVKLLLLRGKQHWVKLADQGHFKLLVRLSLLNIGSSFNLIASHFLLLERVILRAKGQISRGLKQLGLCSVLREDLNQVWGIVAIGYICWHIFADVRQLHVHVVHKCLFLLSQLAVWHMLRYLIILAF